MNIYRLNIFHHLLLFFCLFGDIGLASTGVKPKCIEEERRALVSFNNILRIRVVGFLLGWVMIAASEKGFHATIAPVMLPRWISAWSSRSLIRIVDVAYNNLFGNIPTSMGLLSNLEILKLNNNNFGSKIPDSLHNCPILKGIDLGGNKLYGSMPPWIGGSNVSMLFMLQLRSNFFTGHIPRQLCSLGCLHILDLSRNSFSSTIPNCFNNLTSLIRNFSDTYYPYHHEQTMLTLKRQELVYNTTLMLVNIMDLSSNILEGEIPQEIGSLIVLGTLNLLRNQLIGNIPSNVGNLRVLESLDLSHKHLSRHIPQSLAS